MQFLGKDFPTLGQDCPELLFGGHEGGFTDLLIYEFTD
jgi:hypothetical protein